MRRLVLLLLIIIPLCLATSCANPYSITSANKPYSIWEESQMSHSGEYLAWRKNALLESGAAYPVWEENELIRYLQNPKFSNQ